MNCIDLHLWLIASCTEKLQLVNTRHISVVYKCNTRLVTFINLRVSSEDYQSLSVAYISSNYTITTS